MPRQGLARSLEIGSEDFGARERALSNEWVQAETFDGFQVLV